MEGPKPASALVRGAAPPPGVISHRTAAFLWELPLIGPVPRPAVTWPRNRRGHHVAGWEEHWADLPEHEVCLTPDGHLVTAPLRTVTDCCRILPLYDGVALMDAALHRTLVPADELAASVAASLGPGCRQLRQTHRWRDRRAESAQESVGRVALSQAGMPAEPQFRLLEDPDEHRFDLGLEWAKVVVDLQSKEHHSEWPQVVRDIGYLQDVNLSKGWQLVWTEPKVVLPDPTRFVQFVMSVVVLQPGPRSGRLRRTYCDDDGRLLWPDRLLWR